MFLTARIGLFAVLLLSCAFVTSLPTEEPQLDETVPEAPHATNTITTTTTTIFDTLDMMSGFAGQVPPVQEFAKIQDDFFAASSPAEWDVSGRTTLHKAVCRAA